MEVSWGKEVDFPVLEVQAPVEEDTVMAAEETTVETAVGGLEWCMHRTSHCRLGRERKLLLLKGPRQEGTG